MSFGGGSAPAPPDPKVVSAEQAAANAETARLQATLGRINEVTPWGTLTYSQDISPADQAKQEEYQRALAQYEQEVADTKAYNESIKGQGRQVGIGNDGMPIYEGPQARAMPTKPVAPEINMDRWTRTTELAPAQQQMLDQQNQLGTSLLTLAQDQMGRISSNVAQPFSFGGMPAAVSNVKPTFGSYGGPIATTGNGNLMQDGSVQPTGSYREPPGGLAPGQAPPGGMMSGGGGQFDGTQGRTGVSLAELLGPYGPAQSSGYSGQNPGMIQTVRRNADGTMTDAMGNPIQTGQIPPGNRPDGMPGGQAMQGPAGVVANVAPTVAPSYQAGDASRAFGNLGNSLANASPEEASRRQAEFFSSLDPQGAGEILRSYSGLGDMALSNMGARLAQVYGSGEGNANARWAQATQELMGQGMDAQTAQRQALANMSGGEIAQILQAPGAGQNLGAGARQVLAERMDQIAAEAQRERDSASQGAGQIQRQLDTSQLQAMPSLTGEDPYGMNVSRQAVEDALYQRMQSRLDPQFEQQQSAMHNQLVNQGIFPGSPAYERRMEEFGRTRNDAYSNARLDAILAGGQEQSRLFGLGMQGRQQGFNEAMAGGQFANASQQQAYGQAANTRAQLFNEDMTRANTQFSQGLANAQLANQAQNQLFGQQFQTGQAAFNQNLANANLQNQARATAIQEALMQRSLPLNEMAAFMGYSGGVTAPQFAAPAQVGVAPVDVSGNTWNAYNAQANQAAQQQAAGGQMMSNLFGLGGTIGSAAIMASSRDLKHDIRPVDPEEVLHAVVGMDIPAWKYRTQFDATQREHIGPMAQDFAERFGGNPHMIQTLDAVGVLFAAVKGLAIQQQKILDKLEGR